MSTVGSGIFVCFHCGNRASHEKLHSIDSVKLYEQIDGRRLYEQFRYDIYRCSTCTGVSIFGDFVEYPKFPNLASQQIHPQGSRLVPSEHMLGRKDCVPQEVLQLYEEIWPLRYVSPTAFAGQIRRTLEVICRDQHAIGKTLFDQVKDLAQRGTFSGYFAEMTDLVRRIGNLGAHAANVTVDVWDAELLEDFFRSVVEYVYIAPSKIERLKQRIKGL